MLCCRRIPASGDSRPRNGYVLRKKVEGIHWEEAVEQLQTLPELKELNRGMRIDKKYSHRAKGRGLAEIQIDLRRRGPPGPVYVFCVVGHAKQPAKIDRGPSRNLLGISVDCLKKSLFCMTVVKASGVKVDPTKDAACSENEIEEETEKPHHCCSDPSSSFSNEHVKGQPRIQLGFSRFECCTYQHCTGNDGSAACHLQTRGTGFGAFRQEWAIQCLWAVCFQAFSSS